MYVLSSIGSFLSEIGTRKSSTLLMKILIPCANLYTLLVGMSNSSTVLQVDEEMKIFWRGEKRTLQ